MNEYPEALIEHVARAIAIRDDSVNESMGGVIWQPYIGDATAALDALGFAPYGGPKYWRSAIHVEDK